MGKEKEGEEIFVTGDENPITTELVASKQSLLMKAAVNATIVGAIYGGSGLLSGSWLSKRVKFRYAPNLPWFMASNLALLGAVPASIYTVMEELRGKKDTTACMLAGVSSGIIYIRAFRLRGPSMIIPPALLTLIHVALFKDK